MQTVKKIFLLLKDMIIKSKTELNDENTQDYYLLAPEFNLRYRSELFDTINISFYRKNHFSRAIKI